MSRDITAARKRYARLLRFFPARFREDYAAPLEQDFAGEYADLPDGWARTKFWLRTLADLAVAAPRQIAREIATDARLSLRIYRQRWVLTCLALGALAVAIGATTGVFSVVNALLLRRLPYRAPDRLVQLTQDVSPDTGFHEWRTHTGFLQDAARYRGIEVNLSTSDRLFRAKVAEVSANFFDLLGVAPRFGRAFWEGEDSSGRDSVAVIGYSFWLEMFGGDPGVLASTIRLNGVPMTVIGVAPPLMDYPGKAVIWTPTVLDDGHIRKTGAYFSEMFGRLKPGVSIRRANTMLLAETKRLGVSFNPEDPPQVTWLRDELSTSTRTASLVLLAAVGFVLWIACANVAHILLSRVTERRQELMVRAALGASRARLVQQLVTESVLLTTVAAALGLAVAFWAAQLVSSAAPPESIAQQYTILDWRVLAFAAGLALLTGLVFGVLPARIAGRLQPVGDLVRAPRSHGRTVQRLRTVFLWMQTALAVVLVAGAVTMSSSFLALLHTDLHFRSDRVVTLNVAVPPNERPDVAARRLEYTQSALERLRVLPGVEAAAALDFLPLSDSSFFVSHVNAGQRVAVRMFRATADYFRAMGTDFVVGRDFIAADPKGADTVAIVDEDFQRQAGGGSVVGRRISLPQPLPSLKSMTIVGVVRSQLIWGAASHTMAQLILPLEQRPPSALTFVAKVRGDPQSYLPVCRDVVAQIDRQIPVFDAKTLEQRRIDDLAEPRFYTTAVLFFGGFATLLALIGIYGVASHAVTQRMQEIGVRMAVGASSGRLRVMLLRQNLVPVITGAFAGVAGALAQGKLIAHLIANAKTISAASCAAAAILLAAAAIAAVTIATRRIVKMDPMRVLRSE